jgi:hypothetical protein
MSFWREADHRVVSRDAIYREGAEYGPCEQSKGPSYRVKQRERNYCACKGHAIACVPLICSNRRMMRRAVELKDLQFIDLLNQSVLKY